MCRPTTPTTTATALQIRSLKHLTTSCFNTWQEPTLRTTAACSPGRPDAEIFRKESPTEQSGTSCEAECKTSSEKVFKTFC